MSKTEKSASGTSIVERGSKVYLDGVPVDALHFMETCETWGIDDKPVETAVKRLTHLIKKKIQRENCGAVECELCGRVYPDPRSSADNKTICPFCAHGGIKTNAILDGGTEYMSPAHRQFNDDLSAKLKEEVDKITTLSKLTMRNLHEVGTIFLKIQTEDLWRADVKAGVSTFDEWCEYRTGWSSHTVQRLMRSSQTFTPEMIESAVRIKISGLYEIEKRVRSLPEPVRQEVIERAIDYTNESLSDRVSVKETAELTDRAIKDTTGYFADDGEEFSEVVPTKKSKYVAEQNKQFEVPYTKQNRHRQPSVGDTLRVSVPGTIFVVELTLGEDSATCLVVERA